MRQYTTVFDRTVKGAPFAERCPRRKHRINPGLRVGMAAWLLTMAEKYRGLLEKRSTKKDAKNVPGYVEAKKYAKWAVATIAELVNRLGEQFDTEDFFHWVNVVCEEWGIEGHPQVEEPVRWDQPVLFSQE